MAGYIEANVKTYLAGAAIPLHLRVKRVAGVIQLAGNADVELGVVEAASLASGDDIAVRLRTAYGTCICIAAGAIADGVDVFAAANGKVAAAGTVKIGTAESVATADGDWIEVLRS